MFRILFILLLSYNLIAQENIIRNFIDNGKIDSAINLDLEQDKFYLIQANAINDSLLLLFKETIPTLDLFAGPASYHRIITPNQYQELLNVITEDYLIIIDDNYEIVNNRDYWVQTIYGSNYFGSSGEISETCSCLDANNCVVVGFNDSWYNPFDYYGEAWWDFSPPAFDSISEVRVYVQGAQCDNLPLWSETNVSIRDNNCSWNNNFQSTLSIDYTLNGPYVIPTDQLEQIWCNGNLQPVIGSEDNYTVDFVRMEVYYDCNEPNIINEFLVSNNDYCDYVQLNWEEDILADSYKLYRDNELIIQLSNGVNQYSDYQAIAGVNHEYCIKSTNDCGDSNSVCSYGSRKPVPDVIESISASDGTSQDYIMIEWSNSGQDLIYNLYRDGIQLSVLSGNQNLTYNDEFVELNTVYEYCVEAQNDCGNSDWACDEGYLGIGMIGDINLDNVLDVLDVVLLLNFILEIQIPDNNQIWLSDINSDQLMNILDIVALVSLILN